MSEPKIEIPEVTGLDVAFGNIKHLPKWEDIPDEFKNGKTTWNELFNVLFFEGGKGVSIAATDEVDLKKAFQALKAIMGSFEPKHEHKEAGVSYLMSQSFQGWSKT